jgi:hypothetical protein
MNPIAPPNGTRFMRVRCFHAHEQTSVTLFSADEPVDTGCLSGDGSECPELSSLRLARRWAAAEVKAPSSVIATHRAQHARPPKSHSYHCVVPKINRSTDPEFAAQIREAGLVLQMSGPDRRILLTALRITRVAHRVSHSQRRESVYTMRAEARTRATRKRACPTHASWLSEAMRARKLRVIEVLM